MAATNWHEADEFWETMAPILFAEGRWQTAPAETERVIALLDAAPGAPILDLCCGPGRHAVELARRGYAVTGVDRTAAYLDVARSQAADMPITFLQEDMRTFCQPDAFAGAINLYNSFGYFEDPADDRRVLANIRRSLRPGGTLVLEMLGKETVARDLRERSWTEWEGGFLLESCQVREDWSWLENRWILIHAGGIDECFWGHRLYSARELSELLIESGFEGVTIYGDLSGIPYDRAAQRLVAVAHRPG